MTDIRKLMREDMRKVTQEELNQASYNHEKWLKNENTGEKMVFNDCELRNLKFPCNELRGINIINCRIIEVDFFRRFVYESEFDRRFDFNISSSDFSGSDLYNIDFSHANLTEASFNGSLITSVKFFKANLCRASFSHADLRDTKFERANCYYTSFSNAKICSSFLKANCMGANFDGAKLSRVNFKGAYLLKASLKTNIKKAKFGKDAWNEFKRMLTE